MPRPKKTPTDLLPLAVAAERVHMHRETLRRYVRTGQLRAYRVGPKLLYISAADLAAFASQVPTVGGAA